MNDISMDAVLGRLENGQRQFADDDDALQELKLLGIVTTKSDWSPAGDMEITVVVEFMSPPSRHFLMPYRALRDMDGFDYLDVDNRNLLTSARILSRRLLELENFWTWRGLSNEVSLTYFQQQLNVQDNGRLSYLKRVKDGDPQADIPMPVEDYALLKKIARLFGY